MNTFSLAKTFFLQGKIPLENESVEAYIQRSSLPVPQETPQIHKSFWQDLDIDPSSFCITYDKKGLFFWEGAAFFSEGFSGKIQLQPALKKGTFLGYKQEEILAHEMVHAARLGIDEGPFEEILAYKTSKNSFRKFLGPLFENPKQSMGFITLSLLLVAFSFFTETIPEVFMLLAAALPLIFLSVLLFRLCRHQRDVALCHNNLLLLVKDPKKILAVLIRLRAEEIFQIGKLKKETLQKFIDAQESVRWKLIKEVYF